MKVGFLGSLVPHKGLHVLIDAVNMATHDIRLTVHGSPDSNPAYYRELQTGNLGRVRFAGVADPGDPYPTITQHDVMAIPSLWDENSPLVIHEAQAAGRPVIASNVGGIPELVRDGVDGILFPPGDAQALAQALDDLADQPDKLLEMGRQAKPPKLIDDHAAEIEEMYFGLISRTVPT